MLGEGQRFLPAVASSQTLHEDGLYGPKVQVSVCFVLRLRIDVAEVGTWIMQCEDLSPILILANVDANQRLCVP
jgi:hypothetical protein